MRFFNAANRLERLRRRAVTAGDFIDVTHEARELGLHETVCISKRLWTSLIYPYPFAQPNDCVSLAKLLGLLKTHLLPSRSTEASVLLLLPSQLSEWFRRPCYLKVFVISPTGASRSIVIQPFSDPLPIRKHGLEETLPATLLVRLAETLRSLMMVARTAEQGVLDSMRPIAT